MPNRHPLLPAALCLLLSAVSGIGLAQQPDRPAAVQGPENGEPPAADQVDADAHADAAPEASAFEIRYIIAYIVLLAFVGGSTALVVRPSGRAIQSDAGAAKGKGPGKTKK